MKKQNLNWAHGFPLGFASVFKTSLTKLHFWRFWSKTAGVAQGTDLGDIQEKSPSELGT